MIAGNQFSVNPCRTCIPNYFSSPNVTPQKIDHLSTDVFISTKKDKDDYNFQVSRSDRANNVKNPITDNEARELIKKAHKLAKDNLDNNATRFSKASYGTIILTDKKEYKTGNTEVAPEATYCSERLALSKVITTGNVDKIKAIAVSKSNIAGEPGDFICPCYICLGELDSLARTYPTVKDIQLVTPEHDAKTGNIIISIRTLKDFLPSIDKKSLSYTDESVSSLNIIRTESAKNMSPSSKLTDEEIRKLVQAAKDEYTLSVKNDNAFKTHQNTGAALITDSGHIYQGRRIEVKKRVYTTAPIAAIIEKNLHESGNTKIKGLAIFSKDSNMPLSIKDDAYWLEENSIKGNPQLALIEDKSIVVSTLDDILPLKYKNGF